MPEDIVTALHKSTEFHVDIYENNDYANKEIMVKFTQPSDFDGTTYIGKNGLFSYFSLYDESGAYVSGTSEGEFYSYNLTPGGVYYISLNARYSGTAKVTISSLTDDDADDAPSITDCKASDGTVTFKFIGGSGTSAVVYAAFYDDKGNLTKFDSVKNPTDGTNSVTYDDESSVSCKLMAVKTSNLKPICKNAEILLP